MINKLHLPLLILLFAGALPTLAQTPSCIGINHVGAFPDKPFTGEFRTIDSTTQSQSVPNNFMVTERVARDREGRIREVRSAHFSSPQGERTTTLTMHDGTTHTVTQDELSEVILISDCSAGTTIQIQPGMRIARVTQRQPPASPPTLNRKFSSGFCPSAANVKPNGHLQYEELGFRELQGIVARGCRYTTTGAETDGEWDGKPIRSDEHWVSDDLSAFLLIIRKDFKKNSESRTELVSIKLDDPDPALFKVPDGYLINPTPEQMPKSFGQATAPVSEPR